MTTKKTKQKMFPEFLFVNREVENGVPVDWFFGHESMKDKEISVGHHPQHIAIYKLEVVKSVEAIVHSSDTINPDVEVA